MDDLEFRRRIMSDPKSRDRELNQAIKDNEANAQFAEELLELDATIEQAMKVDVADDLADRILFQQSREQPTSDALGFSRKMLAMAASIAFVVGLLFGQIQWHNVVVAPAYASLSDMAIHHVRNEQNFVEHIDEQASEIQINAKMQPFSTQLNGEFPYHVYYLNHCGFGSANAVHMVFAGEKGKVTLFLVSIPSDKVEHFDKDGMKGMVKPLDNASLIIVGEPQENISKIVKKVLPIIQPMN